MLCVAIFMAVRVDGKFEIGNSREPNSVSAQTNQSHVLIPIISSTVIFSSSSAGRFYQIRKQECHVLLFYMWVFRFHKHLFRKRYHHKGQPWWAIMRRCCSGCWYPSVLYLFLFKTYPERSAFVSQEPRHTRQYNSVKTPWRKKKE